MTATIIDTDTFTWSAEPAVVRAYADSGVTVGHRDGTGETDITIVCADGDQGVPVTLTSIAALQLAEVLVHLAAAEIIPVAVAAQG